MTYIYDHLTTYGICYSCFPHILDIFIDIKSSEKSNVITGVYSSHEILGHEREETGRTVGYNVPIRHDIIYFPVNVEHMY